jgi:amino acid permease
MLVCLILVVIFALNFIFHLGQFIENQLPEQVTLQTFMEDLLKMPSQYVDQVMYSIREQRHRSSLHPTREQNRHVSIEQQPQQQQQQQQQQQRLRSSITATTQSTTSASNES